jgi:hypothetical protein
MAGCRPFFAWAIALVMDDDRHHLTDYATIPPLDCKSGLQAKVL